MGPGAEESLSVPHPSLASPLPALRGPQVGHEPIDKYLHREGGGWGYNFFVSLELEEGSRPICALPRGGVGEGCHDRTPGLATTAVHHHV